MHRKKKKKLLGASGVFSSSPKGQIQVFFFFFEIRAIIRRDILGGPGDELQQKLWVFLTPYGGVAAQATLSRNPPLLGRLLILKVYQKITKEILTYF